MRLSPKRHALAILRTFLGLTQKEMADLAKCATPTIQAMELGKLRLTEERARLISLQTGAGFKWLMRKKPQAPIRKDDGGEYTRRDYERARADARFVLYPQYAIANMRFELVYACWRLAKLVVAACEKDDYYRYLYRMDLALEALETDFNEKAESACAQRVKLGYEEKTDGGGTATDPDFAVIEQTMLAEMRKLKASKLAGLPKSKK